jgi:hypothetical protein
MKKLLFVLTLASTPALAQQSPTEQALAQKLINEMSASVQCGAQVITLQKEIEDLKKQLAAKGAPDVQHK